MIILSDYHLSLSLSLHALTIFFFGHLTCDVVLQAIPRGQLSGTGFLWRIYCTLHLCVSVLYLCVLHGAVIIYHVF
jgi:hypothetical protein